VGSTTETGSVPEPAPVPPGGGADAGAAYGGDVVPRSARRLVAVILALLIVPGVIGLELWPLTGWKLFSLARDDAQTRWVLDAVDGEGGTRTVSLEELPLGYRHAEWPMAELPGASTVRRDDVCQALLGAVVDVVPGTVELRIGRDHQRLVESDGGWTVVHDVEAFHSCRVAGVAGGADADADRDREGGT
jgi:hypothetical protein